MIACRILLVVIVVVYGACSNQQLTEEQRRQLIEEKENRKIKKLSSSQILTESKKLAISRLEVGRDVDTVLLSDTVYTEYYQRMAEAYQYAIVNDHPISDNIEERDNGKIYYTKPIRKEKKVIGFVVVLLDKKEVVRLL